MVVGGLIDADTPWVVGTAAGDDMDEGAGGLDGDVVGEAVVAAAGVGARGADDRLDVVRRGFQHANLCVFIVRRQGLGRRRR